ncbi:hypothetical protein KAH27_03600 [bacterium]|nr:hypothetical protein [bacterium]
MKTVTVKHPSGDWEIKVNVLTPKEREAALKKHGIDPKESEKELNKALKDKTPLRLM